MDRVKPLKIETATDGTQSDPFPTEANPAQDYLAAKGISFENSLTKYFDLDGSGNIQMKDATETTLIQLYKFRLALNNIFDNSSNGFTATNVQAAIEEVKAALASGVVHYKLISATAFTTSSTSDVIITGFTVTPESGTYGIWFNSESFYTTTPKAHWFSIYKAGAQVTDSERSQDTAHSSQNMNDSTMSIAQVNGSQAIDVRVRCDNTGSLTINKRSLLLIRLGP